MRTTIDLPDDFLQRSKIAAVKRRTSVKGLIVAGLQLILEEESTPPAETGVLDRLDAGYHLGGQPLNREQTHARQTLS